MITGHDQEFLLSIFTAEMRADDVSTFTLFPYAIENKNHLSSSKIMNIK